ncbi:hypothetical protein DRF62_07445 [Chryseobacterium piscium]|uniref:Uncharacterized protein n=1 Tax=Chryseobacterium piscium TaxID=333702 RepID=A0A3D9BNJ9_9FLAO|nr:hypothetical protein DRF62_07445 [Chryseobacterium piscium]
MRTNIVIIFFIKSNFFYSIIFLKIVFSDCFKLPKFSKMTRIYFLFSQKKIILERLCFFYYPVINAYNSFSKGIIKNQSSIVLFIKGN